MKKGRKKIALIIALGLLINLVLGNVYAENITSSIKKHNAKTTINPVVPPIEGLEINKVVNNVKDFDIHNPQYDLTLTAKINGNSIVSVASDIVLVLDTSGSMNEFMIKLKDAIGVPETPDKNTFDNYKDNYIIKDQNDKIINIEIINDYSVGSTGYTWCYYDWGINEFVNVKAANENDYSNGRYKFYEKEDVSRIDTLKKESSKFVDSIAKTSNKSKIDVISFSSSVGEVINETNGFISLESQQGIDKLKSAINGLEPKSSTRTDLGLKEAVDVLQPLSENGRKKVVVLFTDGRPGEYGLDSNDIINDALAHASKLKSPNINAVLYSLGTFDESDLNDPIVQDFMRNVATPKNTSLNPPKEYFFNCQDTIKLEEVFTQITQETTLNLDNSKVKDYIDPKFVITEESKALLISQGAEITTEIIDGVSYEVVIWNTDIKPNTEGFTGTITIKPKDSSVYGTGLPTNIEGVSAVYDSTGANIGSFPLPNVDIVNLADELHQEKKSIKVDEFNTSDRTYKITLTAWTTLQKLEVIDPNTGLTDYGASGVRNATVKDYLDPRFEPTQKFLEDIKATPDVQAIQDVSGNWCIEWSNQFIPYMKVDDTTIAKWSKEIEVRAKDEFIGGNDITTNISPISGIYKDDNKLIEFDKPTVNVPVKFNVRDKETTIFYGENVPTTGVEEFMFNAKTPDCFLGQGETGTFLYTWFKEDGTTLIGNISDLSKISPINTEVYKLKVEFIPNKIGDISQGSGGGIKVENTSSIGSYTVNIVKGQVNAIKKLRGSEIWFPNGDPIFTFKLERLDERDNVVEELYDVVRFEKNDVILGDEYTSKSVSFQGLKKGKYRLSESQNLRYNFESNAINILKPCKGEQLGEMLVFYVGYEDINNSTTNLSNNEGEGIFINKKVSDKYFTHTDVMKNTINIKK